MKSVSLRPLADRVLVEAAAAEEKTAGGIIIPDTAKEKPQRGKIIAVGNGKKDEPLTVKSATAYFMVNMPALKLQLKVRNTLSCVKATFSLFFN